VKSLLVGLHSLQRGRRLRVRFGVEEAKLLSVLSVARLPMYKGPAWHRTLYPGVKVGSWIWGESEGLAYLVDIGETVGDSPEAIAEEIAHPEQPVRPPPNLLWFRRRGTNTHSTRSTVTRDHASYDGKMTLCRFAISDAWEKKPKVGDHVCATCQARASGGNIDHPWPIDRSNTEEGIRLLFESVETLADGSLTNGFAKFVVHDEIEFMNELALGDPRHWLDKPPEGYPYRRTFEVGPSPDNLRQTHRSLDSYRARLELGKRQKISADQRTKDWTNDRNYLMNRAKAGPGVRPPIPLSVLEATTSKYERPLEGRSAFYPTRATISALARIIDRLRDDGFSVRPTSLHYLLVLIAPNEPKFPTPRRRKDQHPVTLDSLFGGGLEGAFRAMVSYLP